MGLQLLLRKSYFGKRYRPKMKAGSQYTANMLQPVIDCCQIEIFPIFCSDLHQPSPLRQLHRPATSVNEPYCTSELFIKSSRNPSPLFVPLPIPEYSLSKQGDDLAAPVLDPHRLHGHSAVSSLKRQITLNQTLRSKVKVTPSLTTDT